MPKTSSDTALHRAAQDNHEDVVEVLLANGAEVNSKGACESTPLHRAVINFNKALVEVLLANGAEVNAKDQDGETALHVAAQKGHKRRGGSTAGERGGGEC